MVVQTSKTSFQIVSDLTIFFPCFQFFLSITSVKILVSKSFKMHHFAPAPALNLAKQFQLPKHCFKKSQNAPFRVIAFKTFSAAQTSRKSFQITSKCTIYCPRYVFLLIRFSNNPCVNVRSYKTDILINVNKKNFR